MKVHWTDRDVKSFERSALWFILALSGQVAALQLIEAGNLLRYQHYTPPGRLLSPENSLPLAVLLLQSVAVAKGMWGHRPAVVGWVRSTLRWWQMLGIGSMLLFAAAAAQRDAISFVADVVFSIAVQGISLANILLVVRALPETFLASVGRRLRLKLQGVEEEANSSWRDRFPLAAAIWVIAVAAFLSVFVYERQPHISDEVTYLYHARFLAHGAITLTAPPVHEAFEIYLMEFSGGDWYAVTPPGWPAALAIGVWMGAPWLVNPLLGGLNIILGFVLVRELYGLSTARLVVLLLAASPWYLFMAMNYMTHMFTLTCSLVAALGVALARRTGSAAWGWIGGGAAGVASLIRPMDGLIVAGLVGLWAIGIGGTRIRLPALAGLVLGTAATAALVLPYNYAITGSPTIFPINAYLDSHFGPGRNDLGFGENQGYGWPLQPFPGHSPLGALVNANLNASSINTELFGWGTGSLLFIAIMLFCGRLDRRDYLMVAVCGAVFWPYFFYYYSGGPDFGARYWFLMLLPLVVLTVRGIGFVQATLGEKAGATTTGGTRVLAFTLLLSVSAISIYVPWRAVDKYIHFWGVSTELLSLGAEKDFGRSLVLINGTEAHSDYAAVAVHNPLDWSADSPIYAWNRNSRVRDRLLEAFPDRPVWVVHSHSLTGEGYRIVGGPFPPGTK